MYRLEFRLESDEFEYDLVEGTYSDDSGYLSVAHSCSELTSIRDEALENLDSLCFTISVTDDCNMRCSYCFETHTHQYMRVATIQAIVALIEDCVASCPSIERVTIIWFGGEPTLNLEYICVASKWFLLTCKKMAVRYSSKIISNGLLIDSLIPYIQEIRIEEVQITLDGTQEVHNERRVDINGKGTYEKIIINIKELLNIVDVIIRINISEDNIEDAFALCDELLDITLNNAKNHLYIQPVLIEDYNKDSKSSKSTITTLHTLEKYISLLEYSCAFRTPCFIYAYCNASIPGSLFIRSNGSLCKCWALATKYNEKDHTLSDDTASLKRYVLMKREEVRYEECLHCKIYPVCLGGCSAVQRDSESCAIKYRSAISSILRGFILKRSDDSMHYAILRNELNWLESIGCLIQYRQDGIKVSRPSSANYIDQYYDFNFFIGYNDSESCLRFSRPVKFMENYSYSIYGYEKENVHDINYIMDTRPLGAGSISEEITISPVRYDNWAGAGSTRLHRRNITYYNIIYKNLEIGYFSTVYTNIIGIYDFEIKPGYRSRGHAESALIKFCSEIDAQAYVQTWSTNESARKCYEAAGFKPFEILNRYIKES